MTVISPSPGSRVVALISTVLEEFFSLTSLVLVVVVVTVWVVVDPSSSSVFVVVDLLSEVVSLVFRTLTSSQKQQLMERKTILVAITPLASAVICIRSIQSLRGLPIIDNCPSTSSMKSGSPSIEMSHLIGCASTSAQPSSWLKSRSFTKRMFGHSMMSYSWVRVLLTSTDNSINVIGFIVLQHFYPPTTKPSTISQLTMGNEKVCWQSATVKKQSQKYVLVMQTDIIQFPVLYLSLKNLVLCLKGFWVMLSFINSLFFSSSSRRGEVFLLTILRFSFFAYFLFFFRQAIILKVNFAMSEDERHLFWEFFYYCRSLEIMQKISTMKCSQGNKLERE